MNESTNPEERARIIADMPTEEGAFIQEQLEHFFPSWIGEKRKSEIVSKLPKGDIDFIFGIFQICTIRQDDIDKMKDDIIFCKGLKIVDAIRHKEIGNIENAILFYSNNLDKTVAEYEKEIEKYIISKLPQKKANQVKNLITKGYNEVAQKTIEDVINSTGFKWTEQVKNLRQYMDNLKDDMNFNIHLFSAEAINANPSIIDKVAYALSFPDFKLRFVMRQILDNTSSIPYDWYFRRNLSFNEYAKFIKEMGEDFTSAANGQMSIACSRIKENSNIPVLGIRSRKNLISEFLSLLREGNLESARIVSFVLIEGLLWQIANEVNKKEHFILSKDFKFSNIQGDKFESTRIRDVIKQTVVSKYIDSDFIEHFCKDLYNERNPVLHGSSQCHTCPNAGTCLYGKIIVLDYLIEKLIGIYKNNLFALWDEMPDDVKARVMSTFTKNI